MTTPTPAPTPQDVTASYGFVASLAKSIPELSGLLQQAIAQQWSPQRFTQTVADSNWYQTHADTARKWITTLATDPGSARQQQLQAGTKIRADAVALGVQLNDGDVENLTNEQLFGGLADAQMQQRIGQVGGSRAYDPGSIHGKLAQTDTAIRKLASDYDYTGPTAEADISYWTQAIEGGTNTVDGFAQLMKGHAKTLYPSLAQQIDQGQTVAMAAQPFQQRMSQVLEVDPQSISLDDKNIQKALQSRDTNTGQPTTKPMWEFENDLRQDPRWQKTTNARDAATATVTEIGKNYGFIK
jgi:hypothetical protein